MSTLSQHRTPIAVPASWDALRWRQSVPVGRSITITGAVMTCHRPRKIFPSTAARHNSFNTPPARIADIIRAGTVCQPTLREARQLRDPSSARTGTPDARSRGQARPCRRRPLVEPHDCIRIAETRNLRSPFRRRKRGAVQGRHAPRILCIEPRRRGRAPARRSKATWHTSAG